jgi:hypothetical protein
MSGKADEVKGRIKEAVGDLIPLLICCMTD